jgi:formate hydrogenlyase subunit 4
MGLAASNEGISPFPQDRCGTILATGGRLSRKFNILGILLLLTTIYSILYSGCFEMQRPGAKVSATRRLIATAIQN